MRTSLQSVAMLRTNSSVAVVCTLCAVASICDTVKPSLLSVCLNIASFAVHSCNIVALSGFAYSVVSLPQAMRANSPFGNLRSAHSMSTPTGKVLTAAAT